MSKNVFLSIVGLVGFSLVALAYLSIRNIPGQDIEWFTGKKWSERTRNLKLELSKLPDDFTYRIDRYENSDFLSLWGPSGEYIKFGNVTPEDFLKPYSFKILQIGDLKPVCVIRLDGEEYYSGISYLQLVESLKGENEFEMSEMAEFYNKFYSTINTLPDNHVTEGASVTQNCWVKSAPVVQLMPD